jgi:hypothetical protein
MHSQLKVQPGELKSDLDLMYKNNCADHLNTHISTCSSG